MYVQIPIAAYPCNEQPKCHFVLWYGQGKFGFLFLQRLKALYESWLGSRVSSEWPSVTYVMTGELSFPRICFYHCREQHFVVTVFQTSHPATFSYFETTHV
jgi:hypothetical protein